MATNTEYRAREMQSDPKRMKAIWENTLRVGQKKIDAEPNRGKRERMKGQLEYAKARLEHYKKKI